MAGTIMPVGFKINPWAVVCLVCNRAAAKSLDTLPRCPTCGGSYCPHCLANHEPLLRCPDDPDDCSLKLAAPDQPTETGL
jgi:hypothetical protein